MERTAAPLVAVSEDLNGSLQADPSVDLTSGSRCAAQFGRPTDLHFEISYQYRTFLSSAARDGAAPKDLGTAIRFKMSTFPKQARFVVKPRLPSSDRLRVV